jgi:hypothetical protein
MANQGKLELRSGRAREVISATEITDEDIPF